MAKTAAERQTQYRARRDADGKNISGVSVKGGKGTQRQLGKKKKISLNK